MQGEAKRPARRAGGLFLAGSALLHGAVLLVLGVIVLPDAVEFAVSDTMEFGVTDGQGGMGGDDEEPVDEPPPPPPPPPRRPKPAVARSLAGATAEGDGVEIEVRDAAVPDAAPSSDAATGQASAESTVSVEHGLGEGFGLGAGGHGMGGFAPPGAQIGLYVDLDRVRDSSLSLETSALLEIIPGWRAVLAGSGLEPDRHLSKLFVATPNLRRAQLVIAGRHRGGHGTLRALVARLGGEFSRGAGIETAPWGAAGGVERSVALFGLDSFVLTRTTDLDRVLAVTRAMAVRNARRSGAPRGSAALLAMYRDEAVALVVEKARGFVKGDVKAVPASLRLSVTPIDEFYAALEAHAQYDSAAQAAEALGHVQERRAAWSEHSKIEELGLRSAFENAELKQQRKTLSLRARLTLHQTRYLLQFVSHTLKPRG